MSFDGVRYAVRTPSCAVRLTAYGTYGTPYRTPCDDGVPAYDVPRRGSYTVRRRPGLEGKERKLQKDVDGTRGWGMVTTLPLTATTTQTTLHPMKITKPTESLLNVTEVTRYSYGPHKAILIDPAAGTVTFGWHSPAGYDSDSLSFTGGILTPSEDHKYNEAIIPLTDMPAIERQARKLNISLTREVETPEYLAAVARREQAAAARRALLDGRKAIVVDWQPEHPAVRAALATPITEWELVEETDKEISRYAIIDGLIVEQVEEEGEEPKIERVWMAA